MYVEVLLDRELNVVRRGRLVALSEDGEATLMINGERRYCWPVLDMRQVPEPRADAPSTR